MHKLIVFTETFDYKKRQVIVPILINDLSQYEGSFDEYNVVTSAHGRSGIKNFIQRQIDDGYVVVYSDTKKIQKLNVEDGVQYPASVYSVSNINVTQDDKTGKTQNSLGETSDLNMTDEEMDKYMKQSVPTKSQMDAANKSLAKVLSETPEKEKKSNLKKWARDLLRFKFVDRYTGVVDLAESKGNERLKDLTDWAITSNARASNTIYKGRFDQNGKKKIGKSLTEILGTLPKTDRQLFFEYMYHWRNVDDMSLNERFGEDNKPVFGDDFTDDDSRQRIAEIEQSHPEFKKRAEEIWNYVQEDLKMQIGGLISQDGYNDLLKKRPHYVPIERNVENQKGNSSTDANKLLKKMKGSNLDILPLDESLKRYTQRAYKTFDRNNLFSEIAKTMGVTDNLENEAIDDVMENDIESAIEADGNYMLTFYRNGQKMSVPVDKIIYDGFKSGTQMNEDLKKVADKWAKVNQVRKNLLTAWNPFFAIRNASKDLQDAGWNTKYAKNFPAKYAEAWAQIANHGEFYQQFVNLGGGMSNYSARDLADAFNEQQSDKGMKKVVNRLLEINDDVETAPRLAEFMASLEAGNSVEKAMRDAAEITTNFKRGGTVSKAVDKYGFTFLNASIQGYDKHVGDWKSNVKKARKAGIGGVLSLMAKLTLASGLPLRLLQDFLWRDDKDYEELSDYIKDKYYILGKTKGGKFIRINKGRIATFYQTVLMNAAETIQGKVNMWDAMVDDATSFIDNIAPNNPLENNILAPISQTMSNKTWYGDDIVSSRLQGYNEWDQYDESTDELSKAIGRLSKKMADATGSKVFALSPKKVNYLLDQYSGVIGDVVLPALTLETETSVDNPLLKGPATALLNSFTSDPVLKNQNVADFYALNEQLQKDTKDKNATDEQILSAKYMASVSSEMGKLYAQMHEVQGSDLSNKEKMEQTRELKKQINDLARAALDNYDNMDISGQYASVGGVQYYQKDDGSWVKPSKTALEKLDAAGLSDEDRGYYFSTYGEIDTIRKDIKANTPEGQSADYTQATIDAINDSEMSYKGKNTLLDSYYPGKFTDHVNSMSLSDEEKYNLKVANKLAKGEKDKNGKTVANSKARATAAAYRELGLLDDVLQYIKDNDISPTEMGLSKTVYNELLKGDTSYLGAYSKTSKKSSGSKKKGSKKSSKKGGTIKKPSAITGGKTMLIKNPGMKSPQVKKSYLNAYSNIMRQGSKNVSQGSSSSNVCPNCGNRVSPVNGKCPICGAKL
ncbi:MAG: hypothetical protein IJL85_01285 [Erysipelotrichaceae bacterium]|nr:hypothetical protein [Erysipelotrichaceae bacterium]